MQWTLKLPTQFYTVTQKERKPLCINECNILKYSTCFILHKLLYSVYIIQNYYSCIIQNPIYETYVVVKN